MLKKSILKDGFFFIIKYNLLNLIKNFYMKKRVLKGNLIIADANVLNDLNFNRSVILIAEHSSNGSLGFILNKNLKIKLSDLVCDTDCNFTIHYGGPVESESLYFIHNIPEIIEKSIEISDGIYWGGNFQTIIKLLNEKKIKKTNIRFFLGYTGWNTNQLAYEMESKSWLVKNNIFKSNLLKKVPSNLWKELMLTFGNKKSIWSNAPEDPILN